MKTTSTWRKTSTANILMPQSIPILRKTESQQSLSDPDERERLPYDEQENRQSHLESAKLRGGTVTMSPQPHQISSIFQTNQTLVAVWNTSHKHKQTPKLFPLFTDCFV